MHPFASPPRARALARRAAETHRRKRDAKLSAPPAQPAPREHAKHVESTRKLHHRPIKLTCSCPGSPGAASPCSRSCPRGGGGT